MNKAQKDTLRRNRMYFIENLEVDSSIAYLETEGIFNSHIVEKIKLENKTTLDRVTSFLDTLQRRGPEAYDKFYDALIYTEQYHIADILKPEKAPCKPPYQASHHPPQSARVYGRQISHPTQESKDASEMPDNRIDVNKVIDGKWPGLDDTLKVNTVATKDALYEQLKREGECYTMFGQPRGHAVIINNERFRAHTTRDGTNVDANNMANLLESLHFEVILERNKTAKQIRDVLKREQEAYNQRQNYSAFILVVLSHGTTGEIAGTDGEMVKYEELYEPFDGVNCKGLIEKPKIFFVQACQGENTTVKELQELEEKFVKVGLASRGDQPDTVPTTAVHSKTDILFAMSTFPDYISYRNTEYGSWYMRAIVEVFQDWAGEKEVMELLRQVRVLVGKRKSSGDDGRQVTKEWTTLSKRLFFFPGK